jgi:hypothetical protein
MGLQFATAYGSLRRTATSKNLIHISIENSADEPLAGSRALKTQNKNNAVAVWT